VLDVLLRAEGFACRLDVLYEGLEISKLQFLTQKIFKTIFQLVNFFQYLVIKTLDPDPDWYFPKILDLVPDDS
jgi:hypothetical protein